MPFSHDITAGTGQGGLLSNGTGAGLGGLFIMLIPPEHGGGPVKRARMNP
ncbi:hypothetical protein [Methanospirillum sp.]|nr:hypothetical protein [Methanospirillum sp.]